MSVFRFDAIEKTYVKQYLKTNRRLIIITMVILYLLMNTQFLPGQVIGYFAESVFSIVNMNGENGTSILYLLMFTVCGMAFLLPLYQFRFLMKRISCDLYMSLPIKRKRLYFLQYITGATLLFVTTIPIFILNVLTNAMQLNYIICLLGLLVIEFLGLLLYTFYTWICVKCNTLIDAILVMGMYTILPLFINLALRIYSMHIIDAILVANYTVEGLTDIVWSITDFLSLPWLMRSVITIIESIFGVTGNAVVLSGYMYVGCIFAIITWSIMSIMLYCSGKRSFIRRKSETSEQRTSAALTYPILVPAITICLLFMSGIGLTSTIWIFLIFLFYVAMDFLTKRNIQFRVNLILRYLAIVMIIGGIQAVLINTKVFGTIQEVPSAEDVLSIKIDYQNVLYKEDASGNYSYEKDERYYSPSITEEKQIKSILQMQKQVSTWKENESYEIFINFLFETKDHRFFSRGYPIDREQSEELMEALAKQWIADGILIKIENEE